MSADVLTPDRIILGGTARTRDEAINEGGRLLVAAGAVDESYVAAMHAREASVSTFMGNHLAIPHGTNEAKDAIHSSAMTLVRYDEPIDWDGNPVRVVATIAGKDGGHMAVLQALALAFSDEESVQRVLDAQTPDDVLAVLGDVNV
ncbi:PTS sugar transporter subunit IIA [Microcella sp.]|uniref:PTS sugar transporter subunit IIA n=1 Tax=Microcella sp. TaxID=1913979 RepID=UPI00391B7C50